MEFLQRTFRQQVRGQSLVFVALILPFLVAFIFMTIEAYDRLDERAQMEDALRQATRSAVQMLDYAELARNDQKVDQERAYATARQVFAINIGQVRHLSDETTPHDIVQRTHWWIITDTDHCTYSSGRTSQSFTPPAICAETAIQLSGIVPGWPTWTTTLEAGDTLDRLTQR